MDVSIRVLKLQKLQKIHDCSPLCYALSRLLPLSLRSRHLCISVPLFSDFHKNQITRQNVNRILWAVSYNTSCRLAHGRNRDSNWRLAGGSAVPSSMKRKRLGSRPVWWNDSNTPAWSSIKLPEPASQSNNLVLHSGVSFLRVEVVRENERFDGFVRTSTAATHFRQLHWKRTRRFSTIEVALRVDNTDAQPNGPVSSDALNWRFQSAGNMKRSVAWRLQWMWKRLVHRLPNNTSSQQIVSHVCWIEMAFQGLRTSAVALSFARFKRNPRFLNNHMLLFLHISCPFESLFLSNQFKRRKQDCWDWVG